jgi:hypothetical protein
MKTNFSLLFWVLLSSMGILPATPLITNVQFPAAIYKYQKFEVDFDLNTYLNPYDFEQIDLWAEFISPSGKRAKVFGFYYEGYHKLDDGAYTSYEILAPSGENSWKIRFSPNEIGTWTFKMKAVDQSAFVEMPVSGSYSFFVNPSNEKGFISKANKRFLKYDSGEPYYPIGDSYPWWLCEPYRALSNGNEEGTNIMKHYLDGMQANGINYNRFEINLYEGLSLIGRDFVLQKTFYNYYNQHDAWQLDEIMEYAKLKGINFNLALYTAGNIVDHGHFNYLEPETQTYVYIPDTNSQGLPVTGFALGCWSLFNPSNKYQDPRYRPTAPDSVGFNESRYDYFANPRSILGQKKFARYVMSRWGYCTNLMGLELLDEMSLDGPINGNDLVPHYVPTPPNFQNTYGNWAATMYDYVKSIDPYDHLISIGLGDPQDTLLANQINAKMDFVNVHWYFGYGLPDDKGWHVPGEYSFADGVIGWAKQYDKPVAIMEMNWTSDGLTQDPHYYELHNLIWSALFNGSMGLSAVWAHEVEVLGHNALNQFIGVSAYSKVLPQLSEQDVPVRMQQNGLKWEFLQDNIADEVHGRVQDENFTFLYLWQGQYGNYLKTLNPQDRPPLRSLDHLGNLRVARQGLYRVQWYNTETGRLHSTDFVPSINDSIQLTVPFELITSTWADAGFTVHFVAGEPSLLVYPNPGAGLFHVEMKHESVGAYSYSVYSALGTKVSEQAIGAGISSFTVDINDWSPMQSTYW